MFSAPMCGEVVAVRLAGWHAGEQHMRGVGPVIHMNICDSSYAMTPWWCSDAFFGAVPRAHECARRFEMPISIHAATT
jgi:hypothetical protein